MFYVHNQWYDISCATLYFDKCSRLVRNKIKSAIPTSSLDPFNCWKGKCKNRMVTRFGKN